MTVRRGIATLLATGLLLAGCGSAGPPADGAGPPQDAAHIDPELVANLAPGDAEVVGEAVTTFGFDLLGELADGTGNAVTSPLSVSALLAMVLAGAGGDTAEAIAGTLHLDDPRDVRVGALLDQLAGTDDITLAVANALWPNEGTPMQADYLAFVRETFRATVDAADLGDPATAEQIDAWVREHTGERIEGIADDLGLPDPSLVLVLVNAVYFLGEWTTQFDPDDTVEQPFTLPDGGSAEVPLMHLREVEFEYVARDGYRMLRLPYGGEERYAMDVLLPDQQVTLSDLLAGLDAAEWRAAAGQLAEQTVDELALPRFELEWRAQLNDALMALGMGAAFGGDADFRPMSAANPWLDTVVHKTYLRVDEQGTEAAAVTGGAMITSVPADPLRFVVDRPFAFAISDTDTGTVLFLGTVADPRG